jgi:hypothetical protein
VRPTWKQTDWEEKASRVEAEIQGRGQWYFSLFTRKETGLEKRPGR